MTNKGWKNKNGTSNRTCNCGSWKNHWINNSGEKWPSGEYIVPACDSCNKLISEFDLKGRIKLVSANKQKTCQQ